MDKWNGKVAVVTGASAGIGAEITKDLARSGITVIGLARRLQRVEDLKKDLGIYAKNLHAFHCDVSDEKSVKTAFKWIEDKFHGVNILINNAGILKNATLLSNNDSNQDINEIVGTNLLGLMYCTREVYKLLLKNDDFGYIINISSVLGHSVPRVEIPYNIYPGTKHAVKATTEVLRQELDALQNRKIRVACVSPGLVQTEILEAAGITTDASGFPALRSEDVSETIMFILSLPVHVQIQDIIIRNVGDIF